MSELYTYSAAPYIRSSVFSNLLNFTPFETMVKTSRASVALLTLAVVVALSTGRSEALLLHVSPGQRECVLLDAQEQSDIEASFAVIQTGTRMASDDLSDAVSTTAHDPNGATIYSKGTGIAGEFTTKARVSGTYELCFDNSRGHNEKTVDFSLKTGETHVKPLSTDSNSKYHCSCRLASLLPSEM